MNSCSGNGSCFSLCLCACYDYDDPLAPCSCSHGGHKQIHGGHDDFVFCQVPCGYKCALLPCANYKFCKQLRPQHMFGIFHLCEDCDKHVGPLHFYKNDVCDLCKHAHRVNPIVCKNESLCMHNNDLVSLCKKHKMCIPCFRMIYRESLTAPVCCPWCYKNDTGIAPCKYK